MNREKRNSLNKKGITVLSLCDGMSCGHIAFDRAGIKVYKYFAAEIKEIGIKVAMDNYPDTVEVGDVNKISYKEGILHTEIGDFGTDIDIVIFGSPCQTFSIACKTDKRIGLKDDMKSGLFLQCERILKEVNPKFFFCFLQALFGEKCKIFLENVASPNWRKLQGLGWQLFCQLHSHCRPYLVVIA